jgi:hypothetical protein
LLSHLPHFGNSLSAQYFHLRFDKLVISSRHYGVGVDGGMKTSLRYKA